MAKALSRGATGTGSRPHDKQPTDTDDTNEKPRADMHCCALHPLAGYCPAGLKRSGKTIAGDVLFPLLAFFEGGKPPPEDCIRCCLCVLLQGPARVKHLTWAGGTRARALCPVKAPSTVVANTVRHLHGPTI